MKSSRDMLTNEKLKRRFASQFDLVNHAIKLAEEVIASGRAPRYKPEGQNNNIALQILDDINLTIERPGEWHSGHHPKT